MKKLVVFFIIWTIACPSLSIGADESPVNLEQIASILRFPVSELTIQNVSEEARKVDGNAVLTAYQISSKTPLAFYPILITVTQENTFLTNDTKDLLNTLDGVPEGPVSKGGRGPLGSLPLGNSVSGGLLIGEIRIPPKHQPFDLPELKMAVFSVINIHSRKIDVRFAILAPFSDGENLVKVSGGEGYFHSFASLSEDQNYDDLVARPPVDLRSMFTALNELVCGSLLVTNGENVKSATVPHRTEPPVPYLPSPTAGTQTSTSYVDPRAWISGAILILIVIIVIDWKRRSKHK